ncbi:MAG: PhoH family protein [Anaerofustis sp.]
MNQIKEVAMPLDNALQQAELFGSGDEYIRFIEEKFGVSVVYRNDTMKISGEEEQIDKAAETIKSLLSLLKKGQVIEKHTVEYISGLVSEGKIPSIAYNDVICYTVRGRQIRSKTIGQKKYVQAIKENDIVFGIGPAGTGKTYLAMAMAINAFKNNDVNRIILTRPAVEAGERLGFLPGDLKEKVDPYLRPLYDAIFDIMGMESYERNSQKGAIEIAPLAYMRGRTLDNAFIILDEAQNTTPEQMKMFLTRLGFGSKAVITGDVTQIDLPYGKSSGLTTINQILKNIKGIEFVYLTQDDVVRNSLVQKIINAYEKYDESV